ncbi:MAG: VTT domain-containing protein [Casimicrobiaceae bacterium]
MFAPGRNCWRIERAKRVAFLVDGAEYFGAVREALAKARRSFFILGWDIHSQMRLTPEGANDGLPEPLGDFLNAIVGARRGLRGYVLSWDFAMLYALEREWLPIFKLDWRTHRRLSFRLDDQHPVGASHHQKIVVVDDEVAFVSGYDLTTVRWDTCRHEKDDPHRVNVLGKPYPPFHDVGIVVDGDCARALGELARERWRRATGHPPRRAPATPGSEAWPAGVEPALTDIDVAIARTEPAFNGYPAVGEIRQLHLDAIAGARRRIFAENQYFTSRLVSDAFAQRLREDDAPEIAVISPYTQSGWLEISTMGVLRGRNHRLLRAADRNGRYRLYYPTLPWLDGKDDCLNIHSKVLVVDDELLMIGSANLADRSMGTDTECNLALEARGDPRVERAIAAFRDRLLAEHLDRSPSEVAEATRPEHSLHQGIAALSHEGRRCLKVIEPELDPKLDALVPDQQVLDPERPIDPDTIVADLVPREEARSGVRGRLTGVAVVVVALTAAAVAWRYTPLQAWLEPARLIELGTSLRADPVAPLYAILAFVGGGLVLFPVSVLVAVTVVVFGPVLGIVYALIGATMSGAMTFAIGRHLRRDTVRRLAGRRLNDLSRRLGERGLLAIVFVRVVPVGPFSIVNIVAGASHIRWRDFLLGTLIGLVPGVTAAGVFVDRVAAAIRDPSAATFVLVAAAGAALIALVWVITRKLRARAEARRELVPQVHGS